jgi:RTX calcium-binding nonapeptide repeat (4 copies)
LPTKKTGGIIECPYFLAHPDGTPIMEPVYVDLFDENSNNSNQADPAIGDDVSTIFALGGSDLVETGAGADYLDGGERDDVLWAGDGNNSVKLLVGGRDHGRLVWKRNWREGSIPIDRGQMALYSARNFSRNQYEHADLFSSHL